MSKSTPRSRSVHSDEYKLLVEMLREERKKLGLTQRALSEKLGQHHTYINLIERNVRQINLIETRQICKNLRLSFPEFVERLETALNQMESEERNKAAEADKDEGAVRLQTDT